MFLSLAGVICLSLVGLPAATFEAICSMRSRASRMRCLSPFPDAPMRVSFALLSVCVILDANIDEDLAAIVQPGRALWISGAGVVCYGYRVTKMTDKKYTLIILFCFVF